MTQAPVSSLTDIDLLDLDRWAEHGAPYEWFARLRAEAPVWRHPDPTGSGRGFWVVSSYEQVAALSRCPHMLASDLEYGGVIGLGPGDELQEATINGPETMASLLGADFKFLLFIDPPEHTAYRRLVSKPFAPRVIRLLEDKIRQRVVSLLDAIDADGTGDVVEALSTPLPINVIGDMIGAPAEDHEAILRWSNEAVTGTDPEYRTGSESMMAAAGALFTYFTDLRTAREAAPEGDDLISMLLHSSVEGEELSPVRFGMFLVLLASAGSETTRTAISHGILALHEHPEQWERLVEDPSRIGGAVEEILRWSSPVLYFKRTALEAMELDGQQIEPGDLVSLWYLSANRDEAKFAQPDVFDVVRSPNDHVTFGGGGPHFCLGASLARLELTVVLEELVARYRRVEVTGPPVRLRSNFIYGIKHLPARFELR